MDVPTFRKKRSLTQLAFARMIGLSSKGYMSRLERGDQAWPLELALLAETVTEGLVTAVELRPDLAHLLEHRPAAGPA